MARLARLPLKTLTAAMVVMAILAVGAISTAFWLRAETLGQTKAEVCHAIAINNEILTDLIRQVERESIVAIEEGKQEGTAQQVIGFYDPTVQRLERGQC